MVKDGLGHGDGNGSDGNRGITCSEPMLKNFIWKVFQCRFVYFWVSTELFAFEKTLPGFIIHTYKTTTIIIITTKSDFRRIGGDGDGDGTYKVLHKLAIVECILCAIPAES